jgi:hypothetical protein
MKMKSVFKMLFLRGLYFYYTIDKVPLKTGMSVVVVVVVGREGRGGGGGGGGTGAVVYYCH